MPALRKVIFQVRYRPRLEFYDLLMSAAGQLAEYPHWQTNGLSVTLKDFAKRCSASISHNSFSYEQDSDDAALAGEGIERVLGVLPAALHLDVAERWGYRCQYLTPVALSFQALVSVMHVKLFSQDERLRRIMPQVSDLMYRIDASEDPYGYHLTLGPVRKAEIPVYLAFNQAQHLDPKTAQEDYRAVVESYPDVAVFADLDVYQESSELSLGDARSFVATARANVERLLGDLNTYLFMTAAEV